MTEKEKIIFIINHDTYNIEFLERQTGWSAEKIHEAYSDAHENGDYHKYHKEPVQKSIDPRKRVGGADLTKRLDKCRPPETTIREWTEELGFDYKLFWNIYRGYQKVSYRMIEILASKLHVSPRWLAGLE